MPWTTCGEAAIQKGNGKPANDAEIETIVEVADDLTSQSRHSLLLQGSPPSGKLSIPLERGARGRKRGPEEPPRSGGPSAQRGALPRAK